ncbi:Fic family protein [Methanofollis ethanolicus]|uniref:Fic family protein n=1 Tax=Methanofollis ethanolicus TaxID=488124 RepID=UPI0008376BB9|nr:hypothetical protein [Methanofollis ethanolicus]
MPLRPGDWTTLLLDRFTMYLAEPLTVDVARGATEQVTEQVRRFLLCLEAGPRGRREAMYCPGLSHRPTFLYDYLQPAMPAGPGQTRKYRMTPKGRAVVATGK